MIIFSTFLQNKQADTLNVGESLIQLSSTCASDFVAWAFVPSSLLLSLFGSRSYRSSMDDLRQTTVPVCIAPHPDKLWTTETAGCHRPPSSRCGSLSHPILTQFFHPFPIEQRPILIIYYPPALGCYQRLLRVTRPFHCEFDAAAECLLPVFWT